MNDSVQSQQPLRGRTIVLTRPKNRAGEMIESLERLGARVIFFPAIETVAPENWDALDSASDRINEFDWVIFTSANAVRFVSERLQERSLNLAAVLSSVRTLAIGPATAASLRDQGRPPDVVAVDSKAEGALRSLIEWLGNETAISGLKILIPRAAVAREFLPRELEKLGAQVETAEAYRTIRPDVDPEEIIGPFRRGEVDLIAFTSSSTVTNFASLVRDTDLAPLLPGVAVACIGPITAGTASALGLKVVIQPESYSGPALVHAIIEYFSNSGP